MRETPRVRIGNQTAWSAASPMEPFEYALGRGFEAFEWFPDRRDDGRGWAEENVSAGDRDLIRRTAQEHDVVLSVHGAWNANPLTLAGRHRLESQAAFAAAIGARVFVAHAFPADRPASFVAAVARLAARLARDGMVLAVENTPDTSPVELNELFRHVRQEMRDKVGVCLDIGHANLYPATRNDYLGYVDQIADDVPIVHLHLHENWGDRDAHLPLFTGPAATDASGLEDLIARLARRGFAGCMILEQWPEPRTLLDDARTRLHRMMASTETWR